MKNDIEIEFSGELGKLRGIIQSRESTLEIIRAILPTAQGDPYLIPSLIELIDEEIQRDQDYYDSISEMWLRNRDSGEWVG